MAFTDPIPWSNGDIVTEANLDAMVNNGIHVREEADYWNICQTLALFTNETSSTKNYRVEIDGSLLGTDITTTGEVVRADVSLAGVSDGLHTLELTKAGSSFSGGAVLFRFYKSPDMDYLTWWLFVNAPVSDGSGGWDHTFDYFHVIGHRETKTWT